MKNSMQYYIKLFFLPLSLLILFLSLYFIWNVFNLPPSEELLQQVDTWFDAYGLPILFVSAIIEGMLLIGGYFPGVFVIFVSVILANSIPEATITVSVATTGLLVAHILNYLIGKYGWYRLLVKLGVKNSIDTSREKLARQGPVAIIGSYWLPSIGALTDTAAGIIHMPFRKFITYSVLASILWNFLVGAVVYVLGDPVLVAVSSGGSFELIIQLSIVAVWMLILLIIDIKKRQSMEEKRP